MADERADRHEAFHQIRRSMALPPFVHVSAPLSIVVLLIFSLAPTYAGHGRVLAAGSAVGLVLLVGLEYRKLEAGWRVRRRAVDRARTVPATVEDTHTIVLDESGGLRWRTRYVPVVEFTYESDGEESRSYYAYPFGVHESSTSESDAERRAEALAEGADGTAYYDSESGHAFLVDDPYAAVAWNHRKLFAWVVLLRFVGWYLMLGPEIPVPGPKFYEPVALAGTVLPMVLTGISA